MPALGIVAVMRCRAVWLF